MFQSESLPNEARYDFVQSLVGPRLYFGCRLVLDRMSHIHGIEVRPS